MNPTELSVNRRNTARFIADNPHMLSLIPRTKIKTTTGGTTWREERPRRPQTFRVIESGGTALLNVGGRVPGGSVTEGDYVILGNWDAEIAKNDIFVYRGDQWEVIELLWDNGYERRARVRSYGG